jgi:oxygen-independent coproporphyrinogen-3 oxidase
MSLYLHIPFCKQACSYCDFHFSTSLQQKPAMIDAMCREIVLQKDYLPDRTLQSIYFGGGTPSLLEIKDLEQIFQTISQYFSIDKNAEITLEANPDDLTAQKLADLKSVGINRLSIGIQSFEDKHLKLMNRTHTGEEAKNCVEKARKYGFESLSIDLIYGIPAENNEIWHNDIAMALALDIAHISSYALTIEAKTALYAWTKTKKFSPATDDFTVKQYEILIETLLKNGYEHYEISNFAKPNLYAKHNSNYWKKGHYLGIGASAHSYNGTTRQYNIANNALYNKALAKNEIPCEIEYLTTENHINEYILVNLRTMWGCDSKFLAQKYNYQFPKKLAENYLKNGFLTEENGIFRLTQKGKLIADKISSDFFV